MTQKIITVAVRTGQSAAVERAREECQTFGKAEKKGAARRGGHARERAAGAALGVLGVAMMAAAFRMGEAYAEAVRGYRATGGEVLLVLLPVLLYVAYRTLGDLLRDLRELERKK